MPGRTSRTTIGGYHLTDQSGALPFLVPMDQLLYVHFKDGATLSMAVDGSSVAKVYKVTCPAGKVYACARMLWHISDEASIAYETEFASLGSTLTNGITVKAHDADDSVLVDFLDGTPIKATHQLFDLAAVDVDLRQSGKGAEPETIAMRWSLFKTGALPYLTSGQYLAITIRDNLSALSDMDVTLQGLALDVE